MIQVLVIDDDRHMRVACSRVLSAAGWSAICAEDGVAGIQALQSGEHNIDVVLLDQLLPGISGMETLAQIQAINPRLPVVIITGSATEESAKEIKRMGAYDCLPKPFTPEQLRTVILRAASKPA